MFSHVMLGSSDIAKSKTFYDAILAAAGAPPGTTDARGRLVYSHSGGRLLISKPIDGKPACGANGGTVGFAMPDTAAVDSWHKAGAASGGTSIEDPPGPRGSLYLAYLRDPDGNKLCAVHRLP